MTIHLPQTKVFVLMDLCQQILILKQITLRDLAKVIWKLRATARAITPSSSANKVLTPVSDKEPTSKSIIRNPSKLRPKLHFGTEMVDREFKPDGGKITFTAITRDGNSVGCCSHRRAGELQRWVSLRNVDKKGEFTPHQHSRYKLDIKTFTKHLRN